MPTAKTGKAIEAENKKIRDQIEKKTGKTPEQLFKEREKRLYDAVQLKVPDRVPVIWGGTFFPCKWAGIPYSAAYYDAPAWKRAYLQMLLDLEPDAFGTAVGESGGVLEALETNYSKWPGGNLPPDVPQQVLEQEFMKEDEYDIFLSDPSDFIVRYLLPRTFGAMQPLSKLPPLMTMGTGVGMTTALFATPEFEQFAKKLHEAGKREIKWRQEIGDFNKEMASFGFPSALGGRGGVQPPFSGFTNSFRSFRGAVRDMFKQPDKLKAALDKLVEYRIARAVPAVKVPGRPAIASCGEAHRVSDEILSPKQFEEFVWPFWKKAIDKTFALGYDIISMFFEGRRDKQLHYFADYPNGRWLIRMAETDIFRAKEILGKCACLEGNVPIQMLQMGSTTDVEEYVKKLIKIVGKNGGFILRCSTDFTQEAKPANVKAMMDTVKKYGVYA